MQRPAIRYAADNWAVRLMFGLTTGPRRYLFYLAVAALVGVGAYFPVRDFYVAQRTEAILKEQKSIQDAYNESLESEVESLLSQEGVTDVARRDYGMVMPGEKTITVEGLGPDGKPLAEGEDGKDSAGRRPGDPPAGDGGSSGEDGGRLKGKDAADKSKTGSGPAKPGAGKKPSTAAEVEAAEKAVLDNSPWYWKVLDALFFFDGADGMAVVSTGE